MLLHAINCTQNLTFPKTKKGALPQSLLVLGFSLNAS